MSEIKFHSPSQILDAENAIDDLNIMTGYIWAIGAKGGVFPSEHFIELNEYYHEKYFKELEHKLELAIRFIKTAAYYDKESVKEATKILEQLK